jgi:hypothetical protein
MELSLDPRLVERVARIVADCEGFDMSGRPDLYLVTEAEKALGNHRIRRWVSTARKLIRQLAPLQQVIAAPIVLSALKTAASLIGQPSDGLAAIADNETVELTFSVSGKTLREIHSAIAAAEAAGVPNDAAHGARAHSPPG